MELGWAERCLHATLHIYWHLICLHHNRKIIVNEISWISISWRMAAEGGRILMLNRTDFRNYIDLAFSKPDQISTAFKRNNLRLKPQRTFQVIWLRHVLNYVVISTTKSHFCSKCDCICGAQCTTLRKKHISIIRWICNFNVAAPVGRNRNECFSIRSYSEYHTQPDPRDICADL